MEYPTQQEDKLELVTRFIRDIRRVARKLSEGGAPFSELRELYELAEVFQAKKTDEDLFAVRHQLFQTVKHVYRVIAPCGLGGEGPPWSTVLALLHEAELLAKEVGNAKRAVKRLRSRVPHGSPSHPFTSPTDATSPSHSTHYNSRSTPQSQWPPPPRVPPVASLVSPVGSSSRRDTQIPRTDYANTPHPYLPRRSWDHSPHTPFSFKDAGVELPQLPGSDRLATEAQAKSSTLSQGPPPLLARPVMPRHMTWPTRDNAAHPIPSRSYSYSSTFPTSTVHPPPTSPPRYPAAYRGAGPVHHEPPPLPGVPEPHNVPYSRLTPPTDRAQWLAGLSLPELGHGSVQSGTTSQSSSSHRAPVPPRDVFYEAYAMKPRPDNNRDVSRNARAGSPPPREARLGAGQSGGDHKVARSRSPRLSTQRRYEDTAPDGIERSPNLSEPNSSGAARPSPKSSPGRR